MTSVSSSSPRHHVYPGKLFSTDGRMLHECAYYREQETEAELVSIALLKLVQEMDGFQLTDDYLTIYRIADLKELLKTEFEHCPFRFQIKQTPVFDTSHLEQYRVLLKHVYQEELARYVTHEMTESQFQPEFSQSQPPYSGYMDEEDDGIREDSFGGSESALKRSRWEE